MDNTSVVINGALAYAEQRIALMRSMNASDAKGSFGKSIVAEVRSRSSDMTDLENIIKLVGGQEIGDKAYAKILESQPTEYTDALTAGAHFVSRADDSGKIDDKGNKVFTIKWYDENSAATRKALSTKKGEALGEDRDGAEKVINNFNLRRSNLQIRKNQLKQLSLADRIVKEEKLAALHELKATKNTNIYALGQKLMAAQPIQPVITV